MADRSGVSSRGAPVGLVPDRLVGGVLRVRRLSCDHLTGLLLGEVHFGVYLVICAALVAGSRRVDEGRVDAAGIATMQTMADQIQRQQHTFQQMMHDSMNSYIQLLNSPPFSLSGRFQAEQQEASAEQGFQQASQQWMGLAQQQQETFRRISQQWMEQTQAQQQAFQRMVQESLSTYTNLLRPPR